MGEVGIVSKVADGQITILLKRTEACAKCKACIAGSQSKDMLLTIKNDCGARVGQRVSVSTKDGVFAKTMLIMYGFPFVALLLGIMGGRLIFSFVPDMAELLSFITGIGMMLTSYGVIRAYDKRMNHEPFIPVAELCGDENEEETNRDA